MKKIIIIIIVLLVIGGIIYYIATRSGQRNELISQPSQDLGTAEEDKGDASQTTPITPVDAETLLKNQLTIQARSFIERYASYSSDSGYKNLENLLPLMSQKLKAQTEKEINQGLDSGIFYGLTTKVISIELNKLDFDSSARFTASIQQEEVKDKTTSILYKTADLIFIKQDGEWKIDGINF